MQVSIPDSEVPSGTSRSAVLRSDCSRRSTPSPACRRRADELPAVERARRRDRLRDRRPRRNRGRPGAGDRRPRRHARLLPGDGHPPRARARCSARWTQAERPARDHQRQHGAKKYWPNEDPIGQRIIVSWNDPGPDEIVGVVGDVRQETLEKEVRPAIYWPPSHGSRTRS